MMMNEEVLGILRMDEGSSDGIICEGGNDAVDVRVMSGASIPCVKDGGETELKLIVLEFCAGNISESLSATF